LDKKLKISTLCNYEQSHIFGLRLLAFLQSDLDLLLLIESQYNSSYLLLNLQKSNRPNSVGVHFEIAEEMMAAMSLEDEDVENLDVVDLPEYVAIFTVKIVQAEQKSILFDF
jgi:hypothetical protein